MLDLVGNGKSVELARLTSWLVRADLPLDFEVLSTLILKVGEVVCVSAWLLAHCFFESYEHRATS
jgi:hypothetical protein